jgi:hypothetical protein
MEYELSPDERTVVVALPGWPLAVAVAAPGVPAPHDPDPAVTLGPPLSPPDTTTWGPAQRRLGADEIALQWALWREQIDDAEFAIAEPPEDSSEAAGRTTTRRTRSRPRVTAASGASWRRPVRTWRRRRPWVVSGRPSRPERRGPCGSTAPAGRSSPDRRHRVRAAPRRAGRGAAGGPGTGTAGASGGTRQDGRAPELNRITVGVSVRGGGRRTHGGVRVGTGSQGSQGS